MSDSVTTSHISVSMDKLLAERHANDELRERDPAAFKTKMEAKMPVNVCCFCNDTFRGYGNNPRPVLDEGQACDSCNLSIVIKARIQARRSD